jgi:hypothetical protein
MEYIVISTKDKAETTFFLDLLKKLRKQASTLSAEEMEDMAFFAAMKEGEASGKGDLQRVKAHLSKIIAAK